MIPTLVRGAYLDFSYQLSAFSSQLSVTHWVYGSWGIADCELTADNTAIQPFHL